MRIQKKFYIQDLAAFRTKALKWGSVNSHCCYLNGNNIFYSYEAFPEILAVGCEKEFLSGNEYLNFLDEASAEKDWAFGFQGYTSNEISLKKDHHFPSGVFFIPRTIISFFNHNLITIESVRDPDFVIQEINNIVIEPNPELKGNFSPETTKIEYIEKIKLLKNHIQRGDIYQVNFCTKFEADGIFYDPNTIYEKLNRNSPMPFSGFLKINDHCIVSGSPERYLKKLNSKIISQPMKGTAPAFQDLEENKASISVLVNSKKERAENIMIVDLVRNDLSIICKEGTVAVEKLCELYSFQHIHQLVSTVTGTLTEHATSEIIGKTFPMGSMTGAPKIRAMSLIEECETGTRGPFSGAMGYMDPKGNFDFNVLIRSLFYNMETGQAFYAAGSGITILSEPETEYEECMLKANTIKNIFSNL